MCGISTWSLSSGTGGGAVGIVAAEEEPIVVVGGAGIGLAGGKASVEGAGEGGGGNGGQGGGAPRGVLACESLLELAGGALDAAVGFLQTAKDPDSLLQANGWRHEEEYFLHSLKQYGWRALLHHFGGVHPLPNSQSFAPFVSTPL